MNFDRKGIELDKDRDWLDRRMIAFKHNLMNQRFLYWDIIGSRKMEKVDRNNVQNLLIQYLNNLDKRHPEDIKNFLITEHTRKYKGSYYKGNYWCIQGDGIILGITSNANLQRIVDELSHEVLGGYVARTAIGYYTGNNNFVLPDYDMYVLDFPYFKNQMILGQINDTRPSREQIEEYYRENSKHIKHIKGMESIHTQSIYIEEER